ncbi:MAG: hypothetical protein FJW23_17660 [Acidimicrobiia bacterium]|nr:hypothetical protein [Acidimicrobiia bacterium]
MQHDETLIWHEPGGPGRTCVMISCCAGAELQIRAGDEIVLRELYPDRASLYERAAELRTPRGDPQERTRA